MLLQTGVLLCYYRKLVVMSRARPLWRRWKSAIGRGLWNPGVRARLIMIGVQGPLLCSASLIKAAADTMVKELGQVLARLWSDTEMLWPFAYWSLLALFGGLEVVPRAFRQVPQRIRRWPTNLGLGIVNMTLFPLGPASFVISARDGQQLRGRCSRCGTGYSEPIVPRLWPVTTRCSSG